jgi:hypothetical protein
MIRCHFCITNWVDRAAGLAGVELADLARRRLIAGLLSRPHLILSGPPAIGKGQLARALALAGVDGQRDRICRLQGHPWWAAKTADVARFVELQTDFSLWRLAQFADSALNGGSEIWSALVHPSRSHAGLLRRAGQASREGTGVCSHVVCVERMSPVEIELYFKSSQSGWRRMEERKSDHRPYGWLERMTVVCRLCWTSVPAGSRPWSISPYQARGALVGNGRQITCARLRR